MIENTIRKCARREGEAKKAKEIAKSLLEDGIDIEIVSKNTGLSVEELEKL